MNDYEHTLHKWKIAGFVASVVIILVVPVYVLKEHAAVSSRPTAVRESATFIGREECIDCHEEAYRKWRGSNHDNSMAVAGDSTVLGDFDGAEFEQGGTITRFYRRNGRYLVHTPGPEGEPAEFEVTHVFGVEPLQQYLIPFPGGRLQALTIAWNTERGEWFSLYPGRDIPPGDWLHWTRGAQTWNGMCAECHSTNLIKDYDPRTKTFATTWSEINVSCEACHGPGSRHVEWAQIPPMARPASDNFELVIRSNNISARQQVELCAPCHSRRTELGDYDHTRTDLLDNTVPAILEEGLYFADGQILSEVYVYGSFVQSKMFRNNIRCSDCHDVHSLQLVQDGNDLCLRCHQAEVYDHYDHHFHKKEHEGKPSDGHLCVKCHMPERSYMVIDRRADHSLRVPRPDLSVKIGTPNACNQGGCHQNESEEWAVKHFEMWYGRARKSHYGTVLAAGRTHQSDAQDQLVRLAQNTLYPSVVRATALHLLGMYTGEKSTAAFNAALSDERALVRYTAVINVNTSDAAELVALVAPLLFDGVRAVRMQAAARLAGLPPDLFKPYQKEALEKILAEYKKAMDYSLDFAFAGHNLGNLYARLNDPQLAEHYYKMAIEIDDLFYPAKVNLAMLYNSQGRNKEAEIIFREILDDYPEQHDVAYSLGLLLAEMKRFEEAVGYLERAANGMPNRSRISYNLGLLLQQLGRVSEAESALLRAVDAEPGNIDYLYALADHYVKRGEPHKALPLAERMIETQPQNQAGHDLKAYILGKLDTDPR